MLTIDIPKHHIRVVDFLQLVIDCEEHILKDLDMFDLKTNLNCNKSATKTIFYYYILKHVCDTVMTNTSGNRCVFFYNADCVTQYDISFIQLTTSQHFVKFLNALIKKLNNVLPTLFFQCDDICFDQIVADSTDGDFTDIVSNIRAAHDLKNYKKFTFEKAKAFVKQHGLTYLDREYFNKVKVKMLMYK